LSQHRDTIYADRPTEAGLFAFDERVARVFPDMIQRSVPGYATIIAMTGLLAGKFARPESHIYDLGCSLGASALAMQQTIPYADCRIVGVDNSIAMLARCRENLSDAKEQPPISLVCADIADVELTNASVVVLNFTLQFIPPDARDGLLRRIFEGLLPGGIMVLSEKVTFEDPHLDALNIEAHHEFKRANGYSELEIARKRSALEDVLIPETLGRHRQRISEAGFGSCDVWFQCFNFASLIALK
jgi:tRNA (cmo5U34)-methyltransferase